MIKRTLNAKSKVKISLSQAGDEIDNVKLDVPLFIRMLELAREDIKSDEELHKVVQNVIALSKQKDLLTMDDYSSILNKS